MGRDIAWSGTFYPHRFFLNLTAFNEYHVSFHAERKEKSTLATEVCTEGNYYYRYVWQIILK